MFLRIKSLFLGAIVLLLASGCVTSEPDTLYEHGANPKQHKEEISQITLKYFRCVAQQASDLDDGEVAVDVLGATAVGNCEYQFNLMQGSLYSLNLSSAYIEGFIEGLHRSAPSFAVTTILKRRKYKKAL